ncbi:PREDICTED: uncharacterized protein LOC108374879 isoform X1 [Rhagoletis zephyria]|uniref:uncharacterized protein LOC108374879 isoform X1 n=2 Tax=Rhagoletis zephyria TaxID=28612 RepID=UPI00081173F8|nr:PREDICTED: uncharacterized protein LOC108374879 isoform X1 [Rhagoletis zephyria]
MAVTAKDLNVNRNDNIAHESTLLMSTESQRMSCEYLPNRLRTLPINPEDEEQVHKIESRQSVCISLSSTEDSHSAITVTDSSVSGFLEFDCMTSEIPESGHTGDALIPNTFSNEKADRMEAFLRDVSQQRRELEENKEVYDDNCTLHRDIDLHASKESVKVEDGNKQLGGLAYADTESMTTCSTDYRRSEEYVNILSKKREQDAERETLSEENPFRVSASPSTQNIRENNEDPRRLANDETQVNTSTSRYIKDHWLAETQKQEADYSTVISEQSFISDSVKLDVPEDSVVISETSSENVSNPSFHESRCSSREGNAEDSQTTNSANVQISPQVEISSINISAKINIKISISQLDSSEELCENVNAESVEVNSDGSLVDKAQEDEKNKSTTTIVNNELLEATCDQQRQDRSRLHPANATEENNSENINSEEEEEAMFLTHAERLLNQIYGMSWKTPEVIRTLKRTSRTPKKTDGTPSPTTSKASTSFTGTKFDSNGKQNIEPSSCEKLMDKSVEPSILDDFSIFRRDIVRTNLDSTRFVTPKQDKNQTRTPAVYDNFSSEPRFITQRNKQHDFKVPKTEVKKKCSPKRKQNNVASAERWRQIVDESSETSGDNASDDDTLDKTETPDYRGGNKENEIDKDSEWSITSDDSDGNDYEIPLPKKSNKTQGKKQQQHNSNRREEASSTGRRLGKPKSKDALVYLDLSKDEVTIQEGEPTSPPANNDAKFNTHLEDILRTCKATDKSKLPATPGTGGKSKRKLFTAYFGEEDVDLTVGEDGVQPRTPVRSATKIDEEVILQEIEQVKLNNGSSGSFAIFNKHLEAIKRGDPVFKLTPPRAPATPKSTETSKETRTLRDNRKNLLDQIGPTPKYKYGFLKSLDVCVAKSLCHPDALCYRENYRTKKEELAKLLYELYNTKLFQNKLKVPIEWNKKLCNTAGRCLNKKKMGVRTSLVELSEKVLTSADRLRCTLIHELCHAATWIFNGEGGHGSTWKQWALKANHIFPEIPKIGVCHQYDIEYKYTYKCTLCGAKSHAHSKSKKVENIRCSYCHGAIEIFLNKKDKEGNILPTPVREPTGFAKFVKENYKQYKRPDLKHAEVMKILSTEFAALKVPSSGK